MYGAISGIQGQPLEVTVVSCSKLKDTEWISRQDPYVCVEYGSTKFRTRTCTDGGKNPVFQEKFIIPLIEGLREVNVVVWNSNTISFDDFIGTGKIQLHKVLSQGFDDSAWPLQTKTGRYAGEVKVILHYGNANQQMSSGGHHGSYVPTAASPQVPLYSAPPSHSYSYSSYPPPPQQQQHYPNNYLPSAPSPAYPPPYPPPPPITTTTASSPYPSYSHSSSPYPPPQHSYPPTSSYPPPPQYPPSAPYPPAPAPGIYPPPPY